MGMGPRGTEVPSFSAYAIGCRRPARPWRSSARSRCGRRPRRTASRTALPGPTCPRRAGRLRSQPGVCDIRLESPRPRACWDRTTACCARARAIWTWPRGRCAAGVALRRLHGGHRVGGHGSLTGRRVAWCRARAACWAARAATTKIRRRRRREPGAGLVSGARRQSVGDGRRQSQRRVDRPGLEQPESRGAAQRQHRQLAVAAGRRRCAVRSRRGARGLGHQFRHLCAPAFRQWLVGGECLCAPSGGLHRFRHAGRRQRRHLGRRRCRHAASAGGHGRKRARSQG